MAASIEELTRNLLEQAKREDAKADKIRKVIERHVARPHELSSGDLKRRYTRPMPGGGRSIFS